MKKVTFQFFKFKTVKEVTTHKVVSEYYKGPRAFLAPRSIIDGEYFMVNGTLISSDALQVKLKIQGDL